MPLVLPQPSTAFQVLVIVFAQAVPPVTSPPTCCTVAPLHAVPPVTSPPTCCTVAPLHASVAVGAVKVGVAVHSTVRFATVPMTGGVLSMIEIV